MIYKCCNVFVISATYLFKLHNLNSFPFFLNSRLFTVINPFPNDKFEALPNCKSLQTTILNVIEMVKSSPKG